VAYIKTRENSLSCRSIRDGVKSWIGNFIKVALVLVPSVFIFAISLVSLKKIVSGQGVLQRVKIQKVGSLARGG